MNIMTGLTLSTLLTTFSLATLAEPSTIDCENPNNTLEINHCASLELDNAELELQTYLEAAYQHNKHDTTLIKEIKVAQQDWQKYAGAHCNSVYTLWRDGTIRNVMFLTCKTNLTKKRTQEVWHYFLTYMDSTPPVLPKPKL